MFGSLFSSIVKLCVQLVSLALIPIYPLLLSMLGHFVYYYVIRGRRMVSREPSPRHSIIRRLYFDLPRRFWLDRFNVDPNEFKEQGLHLFCGEQGSGKTTAVVELLTRLQARYPKLIVRTNFGYSRQASEIGDWRGLVKNNNGIYGQAEVIDEIQTWFSSMQSKDFPPEMLTEISQQRKQRKMLIGTAQVFGRVAKPIREQVSVVYLPMTIAGCLTIVRKSKPQYYSEEKCRFKRYTGFYFFVHSDELRNCFDTYKKIDGMVNIGFAPRPDIFRD
ncbi:hypothetical protein FACS189490_07840 [Clostridia bacterium]|nr:hypothetical protein FACS189490_07840 [Clostridia bacterium]